MNSLLELNKLIAHATGIVHGLSRKQTSDRVKKGWEPQKAGSEPLCTKKQAARRGGQASPWRHGIPGRRTS